VIDATAGADLRGAAPTQSAASYLITSVPTAGPDDTVQAVRQNIIGRRYDDAAHVYIVTPERRLVGVVAIAEVLAARPDVPIIRLAKDSALRVVGPDTDREEAGSLAIRAGVSALAVCDAGGRFVGAVPAAALLSILRDEHLEDLHHMAGIIGSSEEARAALTAPPHRRALYRLPWLLVGLAGSAVATGVVTRFEEVLAAQVAVAFFIPAIVYLADAVGTQSEAVAVRGLSVTQADLLRLLGGEVGTGILIGLTLAAIAFLMVWLWFGSLALAATVSIALAAASSVATTIGFVLPWLFARLGFDPAFGSGPVATVIQDLVSLMIYFALATALLL
jgi:magnesium transporter